MPLRIVKSPVQVFRDGKFETIEPSAAPVQFSADEVTSINSANAHALDVVILPEPEAAAPAAVAIKKG